MMIRMLLAFAIAMLSCCEAQASIYCQQELARAAEKMWEQRTGRASSAAAAIPRLRSCFTPYGPSGKDRFDCFFEPLSVEIVRRDGKLIVESARFAVP